MTTEGNTDVRDSTLSALKLSCPSAEVLSSSMENPFVVHEVETPPLLRESENEWSDEEQLIPNAFHSSWQPTPLRNNRPFLVVPGDEGLHGSASSSTSSGTGRVPVITKTSVPSVPAKSPSRPKFDRGLSQDELIERIVAVTRERDQLRQQLRMSTTKHGSPRSNGHYRPDDRALVEELQALRWEVRQWSERYFSGTSAKRQSRPALYSSKELFGHLTDNYAAYLKHPQDRPLLIQAYLWSKLQARIFSSYHKGCGYVWAGVKNEEDAEEYHHWRALTTNLLVPEVDGKWSPNFDAGPILKWIGKFASRIRRKLRPWATQSLRSGKEDLKTIVSAAAALDLKFKKQQADYRFVTYTGGKASQQYGYMFYESEMEEIDDEEIDNPGKVELAVAPALERCGNANGYIYDQSFILLKSEVTCKRVLRSRAAAGRLPRSKNRGVATRVRSIFKI
ncbi:uncharacterized protein BDZ99DRAFT_475931 [Mytilinidion resinicola]|uniref:Uncharacterized protein n=1 Tax=Mytilinidion resinicola TaxID=574789 RepID=A0A6A6YRB1_9PEZI|nr:uncharacterized protein BDZ99DRAFT_475931 [Mytilinidion resinicola]KAF2811088.1 hypothetical protein BDZ99DRAFT_475931 [Mytilinidion resinicola]